MDAEGVDLRWEGETGATRETWVLSLGQDDPLEKGMATHSSILAWRDCMKYTFCFTNNFSHTTPRPVTLPGFPSLHVGGKVRGQVSATEQGRLPKTYPQLLPAGPAT